VPPWCETVLLWRRKLCERSAFGSEIGLGIVSCSIDAGVPEPAANNGYINPGGNQRDRCGVSKRMRRNVFLCQGRNGLRGGLYILRKLESHSRCAERLAVAVYEHRLIVRAWSTTQECLQQLNGLGPQRTNALSASSAEQAYRGWSCKANCVSP
jgi:hypothetical protein